MQLSTMLTASILAITVALATVPASADEIDRRQATQQQRIQQGYRSGQITRQEYHRLQAEQAYIAGLERRAERDGRIDRYEQAQLRHAQDRASRHIATESHDGETRWSRWYRRWW